MVIGEDDGLNKTYAYIHSGDVKRESYDKAKDEWTWVREAIVDGKIVDLREVDGGTDLSALEDMDQNNWYEVKTDADGNVTDTALIDPHDVAQGGTACGHKNEHGNANGTAANAKDYIFCADKTHFGDTNAYPKFNGDVEMVYRANKDNDSVILFQKGFEVGPNNDDITYRNGTLYVNVDGIKGFDVSPDVKTVLCLSDGEGNAFDDVIDTYEGYKGLENAIRNLDSNFTGDLSVVFERGSAVVIIFNDTTDVEEDDDSSTAQIVGMDQASNTAATIFVYKGNTLTDITAAKDTVTVTADKATAGTAQDFTQGAYYAGQTAKTIEISAFTGDTAISIAGTHTI